MQNKPPSCANRWMAYEDRKLPLVSDGPELPCRRVTSRQVTHARKPQREMDLEDEVFGKYIAIFQNKLQIKLHPRLGRG